MKKNMKRWAGLLLALVMVLSLAACASVGDEQKDPAGVVTNGATVGTGAKTFAVEVTDGEGKVTAFTVKSDEKTVGAALLALEIIAGDESQYGLYVKTVNGITLDYDTDKLYWAFYINGEYAMAGVDSTAPVAGATYTFKAQK